MLIQLSALDWQRVKTMLIMQMLSFFIAPESFLSALLTPRIESWGLRELNSLSSFSKEAEGNSISFFPPMFKEEPFNSRDGRGFKFAFHWQGIDGAFDFTKPFVVLPSPKEIQGNLLLLGVVFSQAIVFFGGGCKVPFSHILFKPRKQIRNLGELGQSYWIRSLQLVRMLVGRRLVVLVVLVVIIVPP